MKNKFLSRFLLVLTLGGAFSLGAFFAILEDILHDLPKLDQVEDYKPFQISRVLDDEDRVIGEFYVERRTLISVSSLPSHVRDAFLAAEDADFYQHQGIDYFGIIRALINEVKYKIVGGSRIGGSTITQQTAKTMLLSRQRTYTRKIKEFIIAKRIEDALSKDQILNLYLNQIYFGNGVYGLEEAAKAYYGVPAYELSLAQAASLATIPKSPNRINPIRDPERVKVRRTYVLEQMISNGFISEAEAIKADQDPIKVTPAKRPEIDLAAYYVEEVRRFVIDELGEEALFRGGLTIHTPMNLKLQKAATDSMRWGLRVLDKRQGYRGAISVLPNEDAEQILSMIRSKKPLNQKEEIVFGIVEKVSDEEKTASVLIAQDTYATLPMDKMAWARKFNPDYYTPLPKEPSSVVKVGDLIRVRVVQLKPELIVSLEQTPLVEGALVSVNPQTHEVLSMVGGYDFDNSKFNRATQAKRQPGSSFKPFVYGAAIDAGIITPASLINDAPKEYENWTPQNDSGRFRGETTVRSCLISSINMCSITILEEVGIQQVLDLANRVGEVTPQTPMPRDLTLALGSGEVIPLLHVNAYSIFPNSGKISKPILVNKIISSMGELLFEAEVEEEQAIKASSAFVMTNMLRGWMDNSGRRITGLRAPLAGKTGTTNEFRNAWFVGFSQNLLSGVYVGFDDNRSLGYKEYGARVALPIWGRFMEKALKVLPPKEFIQPESVVWRLIDPSTGTLADPNSTYDPGAIALQSVDESEVSDDQNLVQKKPLMPPIMEAFVQGTEPGRVLEEQPLLGF